MLDQPSYFFNNNDQKTQTFEVTVKKYAIPIFSFLIQIIFEKRQDFSVVFQMHLPYLGAAQGKYSFKINLIFK